MTVDYRVQDSKYYSVFNNVLMRNFALGSSVGYARNQPAVLTLETKMEGVNALGDRPKYAFSAETKIVSIYNQDNTFSFYALALKPILRNDIHTVFDTLIESWLFKSYASSVKPILEEWIYDERFTLASNGRVTREELLAAKKEVMRQHLIVYFNNMRSTKTYRTAVKSTNLWLDTAQADAFHNILVDLACWPAFMEKFQYYILSPYIEAYFNSVSPAFSKTRSEVFPLFTPEVLEGTGFKIELAYDLIIEPIKSYYANYPAYAETAINASIKSIVKKKNNYFKSKERSAKTVLSPQDRKIAEAMALLKKAGYAVTAPKDSVKANT